MKTLKVRNVHEAFPEALHQLHENHVTTGSRNGDVWVAPLPGVTTMYSHPCERVLFWQERDANPFFHFMESLWMLAGRNDVFWIQQFNSQFGQFSDDGTTFHGAYGHRWRIHFGFDQLLTIVERLKNNPQCRRQVLEMWDAREDLGVDGKDFPCNTHCYFQRDTEGALHLLVSCRSNDIIWGCYGANAVHFSMLLEFMAAAIGCPVGTMTQVSFNWHGYLKTIESLIDLRLHAKQPHESPRYYNPYESGDVSPFPLVNDTPIETWQADLAMFISQGTGAAGYRDRFFRRVALPLLVAWETFKNESPPERYDAAKKIILQDCEASDWQRACFEWLERRHKKWLDS